MVNYIQAIVKILKFSKQKSFNHDILLTQLKGQLSDSKTTKIVDLLVWINSDKETLQSYKINDYILVEGYLLVRNNKTETSNLKSIKKATLIILKAYPFHLNNTK